MSITAPLFTIADIPGEAITSLVKKIGNLTGLFDDGAARLARTFLAAT